MVIIVIGAGKVGFRVARQLVQESHDVVLVDIDGQNLEPAREVLDVMTIHGNGAGPKVLEQAGVESADMVIAVTGQDEVNILACLAAKHYGVKTTVARVRNSEYSVESDALVRNQLGVDIMIHPERLTAREIVNLLRSPTATEVRHFADGSVELLGFKLNSKTSPLTGKTLEELRLKDCLIVAVDRDSSLLIPRGKTRLEPGDRIYMLGKTGHFNRAGLMSGIMPGRILNQIKTITIVGGGETGFHACQILEGLRKHGLSLKLIEKDAGRARWLAENLPHTLVIHGDGTNVDLLDSENIAGTDAFVTATSHDETNIMAALLANRLGVKETIIRLEREEYGPIADAVGIYATVVPRLIMASTILRLLQEDKLLDVTFIKQGKATVLEAIVSNGAPVTAKPLKHVGFPENALIGMLVRKGQTIIPRGDTQVLSGDRVVAFSLEQAIPSVRRSLGL
jgi:trk system potassium uptake protein TrkA